MPRAHHQNLSKVSGQDASGLVFLCVVECLTVLSAVSVLRGDFLCSFCRSLSSPEMEYCDDSKRISEEQGLNPEDQRVSVVST